MSNITIVPPVMLASHLAPFRVTAIAGEAITAGMPCYIASTGLAMKSVATIAAGSQFDGVNINAAAIGEPVTLFQQGAKINIGTHGVAIGAFLFVSDTAGLFSTACIPTPLTELPVAKAITTQVIEITRMDRPAVAQI